jgi:hypothetical protein
MEMPSCGTAANNERETEREIDGGVRNALSHRQSHALSQESIFYDLSS